MTLLNIFLYLYFCSTLECSRIIIILDERCQLIIVLLGCLLPVSHLDEDPVPVGTVVVGAVPTTVLHSSLQLASVLPAHVSNDISHEDLP